MHRGRLREDDDDDINGDGDDDDERRMLDASQRLSVVPVTAGVPSEPE